MMQQPPFFVYQPDENVAKSPAALSSQQHPVCGIFTFKMVKWFFVVLCQIIILGVGTYYEFQQYDNDADSSSLPWQTFVICSIIVVLEIGRSVSGVLELKKENKGFRDDAEWADPYMGWQKRCEYQFIVFMHFLQLLPYISVVVGTLMHINWPKIDENTQKRPETNFATAVTQVVAYSFVLEIDDKTLEALLEQIDGEVKDAVEQKEADENDGYATYPQPSNSPLYPPSYY
uniref:Uncharacterized protein n=1 Tax=Eutreptiella gymnastica TaxID=73025 RepID=A0A7S1IA70_9EUGL|mmetsp:Transcript_140696/g.245048  ORF Transcript_140696/g.245048 Transcript_140696/m.245048 type:complete len:231 (+) Transcript_140696:28-720(+)